MRTLETTATFAVTILAQLLVFAAIGINPLG